MFSEMFKNDFNIYTTTSPKDALVYLNDNLVDLVITDQLMPEMTGVEFLKGLDHSLPTLEAKRVMISGMSPSFRSAGHCPES